MDPPSHAGSAGGLAGEQSPQHNPHAFSDFAPVIIPNRSGWSSTPLHSRTDHSNGLVAMPAPAPHLPRKPGAHVWSNNNATHLANASAMDVFSPALPEHLPPQSLPDSNPFAINMSDASDALPSPLPKVVVSPRHETGNRSPFHGRMQYSPTHSTASTVTLTGTGLAGEEISPQTGQTGVSTTTAPISRVKREPCPSRRTSTSQPPRIWSIELCHLPCPHGARSAPRAVPTWLKSDRRQTLPQ